MSLMAAITWQDWLILGGGIALFSMFLILAWWALSGDPPGDRRRCPRCWYELTHSPGMRCAECGFTSSSERAFRRRRRRLPIALLAIVACVAISVGCLDRVRREGWTAYVPTRVLIATVPWADRSYGDVQIELRKRIRGGGLDDDHWLTLINRCVTGDRGERPPSRAWEGKYGTLLAQSLAHYERSTDEEWRRAAAAMLDRLPPRIEAIAPEQWPSDMPPAVGVYVFTWWTSATEGGIRLRAHPRQPAAPSSTYAMHGGSIQSRSFTVELPPLAPGTHEIEVDVVAEFPAPGGWDALHRETLRVPMEIVAARRLDPVAAAELDEAVLRTVSSGLIHHPTGGLPVRVGMNYGRTATSAFEDTAIGLEIEVFRNGRLGRRLDIWWLAGRSSRGSAEWEVPIANDDVLAPPPTPDDVWTVRASSSRRLALRVFGATRYWTGRVETPVPITTRPGPAPPRGWLPADGLAAEGAADDTMPP